MADIGVGAGVIRTLWQIAKDFKKYVDRPKLIIENIR